MNVVKELVDRFNCSKYSLAKELGVSWNTIHMWYKNVYSPVEKYRRELDEKLKEQRTKKKA